MRNFSNVSSWITPVTVCLARKKSPDIICFDKSNLALFLALSIIACWLLLAQI
jgi:hypothetical protein